MDAAPPSDRHLIERFRAGDRDAFTVLYRTHSDAIFRFAFYLTGDRTRAAELTQDVFVWLIHHTGEFDPRRGDLGAFLGGVARKLQHRHEREERRWLPIEESATDADPSTDLDSAVLRRAIARLPMPYREAVILCDLESQSYEEAAAHLGCAVGTIRSRLHRARALLARKLRPKKEIQRCLS